ncbi:hypothetical protein HN011_007708 [Eciton burchellii]|nr:hypothetical protein HN011_007708 [Eciton burchellii]
MKRNDTSEDLTENLLYRSLRFHGQTSSLHACLSASKDIFFDYCPEQGEQSVRRLDSTVIVSFTAGHDTPDVLRDERSDAETSCDSKIRGAYSSVVS